ncbi:hypothetical protein KI387_022235, partial [Taxus chinensis]
EFEFIVVVNPGKRKFGPDHLSRINSDEDVQSIEDIILDAQLFKLNCAPSDLEYIVVFLCTSVAPE